MIIALLLALQPPSPTTLHLGLLTGFGALQDPIAWQPSIEDGLKAAEKSGKPVFIFFGCN